MRCMIRELQVFLETHWPQLSPNGQRVLDRSSLGALTRRYGTFSTPKHRPLSDAAAAGAERPFPDQRQLQIAIWVNLAKVFGLSHAAVFE